MKKLEALRKIAERISHEHEINWDEWEKEDARAYTDNLTQAISEYEALVKDIEDKPHVDDSIYEYVMETLLSAYVIQFLLVRKKKIEEVILAKV